MNFIFCAKCRETHFSLAFQLAKMPELGVKMKIFFGTATNN